MTTLYLGLASLLIAIALFILSSRQKVISGLPGGRVIYTDTRAWGETEKPLFDAGLGLTGKPDYIVSQKDRLLPVEVKSGRAPQVPYDSHIYQLAAYCLLVEKTFSQRPPYGILHYPGRDFAIDYTPRLEAALLDLLADMRRLEHRASAGRSHDEPNRCRHCGFRGVCDQKLV